MGTFDNIKHKNIKAQKFALGIMTILTLIVSFMMGLGIIVANGFANSLLSISFIIVVNIISIFKYYPYYKNKMELRDIDVQIYSLAYSFLTYLEDNEKEEKLKELFSAHFDNELSNLYTNCSVDKIDYRIVCEELSNYKTDVKYFAIYTLLDIAADDNIYSIREDKFIDDVRELIGIHKMSFQAIKKLYINKGLKEERKILEEEARRNRAKEVKKSFLPYSSFKILGISPSVTKKQLKKAYRNLVKKYHPDKYYGQNNKIIEQMEIKFQEITEAYEIIKSFKNY